MNLRNWLQKAKRAGEKGKESHKVVIEYKKLFDTKNTLFDVYQVKSAVPRSRSDHEAIAKRPTRGLKNFFNDLGSGGQFIGHFP